jgi:iron complex transport system substrate-binding protein
VRRRGRSAAPADRTFAVTWPNVPEVALIRVAFACFAAGLILATQTAGFAEEVRVVDQRGRTIHLEKPAERVVAIPMPIASVVMALDGSAGRVVGMHPMARKSIEDGFLRRVFPEALSINSDVTRGGTFNPNLETILQLRPSVVIQWTEPADLITALENVRLPVVGLINNPPNQDVHERNLSIIGAVIGQRERTETLLVVQRRWRAEFEAIAAGVPDASRPHALYLRLLHPSMNPAGAHTYQNFWMHMVGGRNVAETPGMDTATINLEQIIAWNPQIIFLGAFDNSVPADLLDNAALRRVDAIRDRRVYKLPHGGYRWDPGSHESHLGWQWAATLMHPDRFRFDLRQQVRETYRFLYRYGVTNAEIDEILQMSINRASAGYDTFAGR